MTGFHTEVPAHPIDVVLARPTATSMTVSIVLAEAGEAVVEYWPANAEKRQRTKPVRAEAGKTVVVELTDLTAGAEYRYRVGVLRGGPREASRENPRENSRETPPSPTWFEESRFQLPRPRGTPFGFVIQADSHLDANMSPEVYAQTLRNMRADALAGRADFLVDLGDTFMTDKRGRDFERSLAQYDAQRYYFGLACDAMPLFMVLGNHDGEKGDAPGGMGDWSYRERTTRFPEPRIDGAMYTGETAMREGRGANYFAFEWGDALIVVLDPFWPTTERSRGGGGGGGGGGGSGGGPGMQALDPVDSSWSRTLGRAQYDWLAETLSKSTAKQKFVFTHHLVGGVGGQAARGGVESAPFFEWGGRNADGSDGFAARRAGWPMPIHQLLVKHGVTAVFHGHDHLYVHSTLDGIHYQCVPQPGNLAGGTRSAGEYGYASGTILGSPGSMRVSVAADGVAKVEFVRTAVGGDVGAGTGRGRGNRGAVEVNGSVPDSYEIAPRGAAAKVRTPAAGRSERNE
ncbi:MAG: hypothetical protein RI967_361 [Planctomycetota bacterium]